MQKYEQICYDALQHLDHSPTGRVLESFAPARGDMHSPWASVKYTPKIVSIIIIKKICSHMTL